MPSPFAELFKRKRKELGLKVADVCNLLESKGNIKVASSTLYGYENGTRFPNEETLLALCRIYDIPMLEDFEPETNLTFVQSVETSQLIQYANTLGYYIGDAGGSYYIKDSRHMVYCDYQELENFTKTVNAIICTLLRSLMRSNSGEPPADTEE